MAVIDAPPATFRVLEVLSDRMGDETLSDLSKRLSSALRDFPGLAGETVTVGRLKPASQFAYAKDPLACAEPWNMLVQVPHDETTSTMTLYHELAHLEIYKRYWSGDDLPRTSEPFTSLYAVARMGPWDIDTGYIAYIGSPGVSRERWPAVAQRSLRYREDNRDYVQQAKEWYQVRPKLEAVEG